jgi:sugar (pentulose or hexulose) kinase
MEPVAAVFDLGKTNKKLLLLNRDYEVVWETSEQFAEIKDDDGDPCEDIKAVRQWFKQSFKESKKNKAYSIRAVNVSAYGATLINLDQRGRLTTPVYNYLKSYPERLAAQFYAAYGGREVFSIQTSSPAMGMLNTGLQLYWLKHHRSSTLEQTSRTLHLPQYFTYLLHGKMYSEITSLGCHTGLWDFERDRSHDWVYQEKLTSLLPPVVPTASYEEITNKNRKIFCGVGIHDSSAALVPYLMGYEESFMLLSTGTWSITLNPFNDSKLTAAELRQDCLQYMSFRGTPVRAARLLLGREHDHQAARIAAHFNTSNHYYRDVEPNLDLINTLLGGTMSLPQFYPQTMHQTGPFPDYTGPEADLSRFSSYEEAYHQLMIHLVKWQVVSLHLAQGTAPVRQVFVSGGFCRSALFLRLLASFLPETRVCTAQLEEASALGAALVLHRHWNRNRSADHLVNAEPVPPLPLAAAPQLQDFK